MLLRNAFRDREISYIPSGYPVKETVLVPTLSLASVSFRNSMDIPQETWTRSPKRILIVGMGMTALAFIEKLFTYEEEVEDLQGVDWQVTVVGDEPWFAYNRVGLTQYLAHRSVEALYLQPPAWYSSHSAHRLDHVVNDPIIQLDLLQRKGITGSGLSLKFDLCVLATGSRAAIPPYIHSNDLKTTQGLFVYRTIEDLEKIADYAKFRRNSKVAIIGGGLLGLEAAKALFDLSDISHVSIVERNKWVLCRQLDEAGAQLVLEHVRSMGINVLLETHVQSIATSEIDGHPSVVGLCCSDGVQRPFDMVVFAIGITPRGELAKECGIKTDSRGGIIVHDDMSTSSPNIYAIGECASWKGETYGIISPCTEMADILAYNLTLGPFHKMRKMTKPDMSTKLKLAGINMASFGDYFADQKPLEAVDIPGHGKHGNKDTTTTPLRSLVYNDPFSAVYKKYIFTGDGKYLLGGMLIGDIGDYAKLVTIVKKRKALEIPPGQLILGVPRKDGESDGDELEDSAQVCSCYNVSKGNIIKAISGGCQSFGEVKSKTKVSTGCGGCTPLATSIFNSEMKKAGHTVTNYICSHFKKSRQDLFMILKVKNLTNFSDIMREVGENPQSLGCEICKPVVASILSSLHNVFILDPAHHQNQDTNDRYLANIQRNGTYSVIPRIPAGEITPAKLKTLALVAEKYGLYTKITGGQRVDLFGAKKQDLPAIWEELGLAGFESGHAYGKALRTVKSCVGTTWCRYGVGDSVGLAVELEERYKGIRAPHKLKGGVSGCVRECAEAQGKDFGVIATSSGWNVYVGGNGGSTPRHAELLAVNVSKKKAVRILDRFLMLYIQSADRLQRTARWIESLGEGGKNGLEYLKRVIIDDSLGICKDLDQAMERLVGVYFDEWAEVVRSPEKRSLFRQFANTDDAKDGSELVEERGQYRPASWPKEASPLKFNNDQVAGVEWKWHKVATTTNLHPTNKGTTSIVINYSDTQIAIFRLADGKLYATQQMCPHRRAFVLADGLVGDTPDGKPYVSCPLHKRNFSLQDGKCLTDNDYNIMTFEVKEEDHNIYLKLPGTSELDSVLGTAKWMVREIGSVEKDSQKHIEIVAPSQEIENGSSIADVSGEISMGGTCMAGKKELEW